jgi:hypothetical protein
VPSSSESRKRWKKKHPDAARAIKRLNYRRGALHDYNSCRPWSVEDSNRILAVDRPTDRELAKKIGRSVNAIQHRRHQLKHGEVALSGIKTTTMQPVVRKEPRKPRSPTAVRLEGLRIGLKFEADASIQTMQILINRYLPYYKAGVVIGAHSRLAVGDCEVIRIHPATRKARVRIVATGKERFVSLDDIRRAGIKPPANNNRSGEK